MKKLLVANWKCNPTSQKESKAILSALKKNIKQLRKVEVVIAPPFVYLAQLGKVLPKAKKGAQNCFWADKGSYTGEISAKMLKDMGCHYVIIGHSERRNILEEGDRVINKKIKKVLEAKMRPILCIGEEKEDKHKGRTFKVLERQLREDLKDIKKKDLAKIIIAYEPVWAIGQGTPCEENQVMTVALFIKKTITRWANKKTAEQIAILYGGSVDSENLLNYTKGLALDGFLVGGSSLRPKEFAKMIKILEGL